MGPGESVEDRKEYPMSGFRFICGDCGKIEGFMTGMDFSYRRTYRATRQKAEEGAFGEKLAAFLHDHPEAALNPENRLYLCPSCGAWRVEPDLSAYLPLDGRTEPEPFVLFEEDTGEADGYRPVLPYEHRCACGGRLEPSARPGEEKLRCRSCGGTMEIDVEMGSEQ